MDRTRLLVIAKPGSPHLEVLEKLGDRAETQVSHDLEALRAAAPQADVLLNAGFQGDLFQAIYPIAKNIRWAHQLSAGVENVLSPEVVASPIPLTNGRGVFRDSLAEFALAAMLFFAKDLRRMVRNQTLERWEPFDVEMLKGKTLGVVGYGEIGRAAASLANGLGVRIVAVRRKDSAPDGIAERVFPPEEVGDMLAESDYVLIAAPNTPSTRGMIGAPELNRMKAEAVIINVGRGPVIVESALVNALESNSIRGAALDVFDHEPLPAGHPFWKMENVLISPHTADHIRGWIHSAMEVFIENFGRFQNGQKLLNIVDKKAGY